MATKRNPGKYDCYERAAPDEPLFTLLGRDPTAPFVVRYWMELRRTFSTQDEVAQLEEARECAFAMEEWAREKWGKASLVARVRAAVIALWRLQTTNDLLSQLTNVDVADNEYWVVSDNSELLRFRVDGDAVLVTLGGRRLARVNRARLAEELSK